MRSWRSTLAGVLSMGGIAFATYGPPEYQWIGHVTAAVGVGVLGVVAQDHPKSPRNQSSRS